MTKLTTRPQAGSAQPTTSQSGTSQGISKVELDKRLKRPEGVRAYGTHVSQMTAEQRLRLLGPTPDQAELPAKPVAYGKGERPDAKRRPAQGSTGFDDGPPNGKIPSRG